MFEDPKRVKKYLKVALQGGAKVGKTRFSLSFPNPQVIDGEHGTDPYTEKYDFRVRHTNSWKGLGEEIAALVKSPVVGGTLVIDPITVFYQDLLNDLVEYVRKKRNHDMLSQAEWTLARRRWAAFLNMLVRLPMHIVLDSREREEYVESVNTKGEEIRRKTGHFIMECDKQTEYLFDVILRLHTEENKKEKTSKHLVTVLGTRYDWLPKYSVHDVTGKRAFDELFAADVVGMLEAPDAAAETGPAETLAVPEVAPEPVAEGPSDDARGTVDRVGEALDKFTGQGDQSGPKVTTEDIKVLMATCNKLTWPDGSPFKSADGKTMIRSLYKLESTKDLRKYQADFLIREFGEVLSGRSILALDETGVPYVRRKSGVTLPEIAPRK